MAETVDEVMADVTRIFQEVLENDSIQLNRTTTANDVKEWDSLNHIELVLAIEKYFKIRFNFAELQKFQNVGEICDNIVLRLSRDR
jgi:acyl carrier protein